MAVEVHGEGTRKDLCVWLGELLVAGHVRAYASRAAPRVVVESQEVYGDGRRRKGRELLRHLGGECQSTAALSLLSLA